MGTSNHQFQSGSEVSPDEEKANIRLDNVAADLSTSEQDAIKNKLGVTGGGTATSRTVKQITDTTSYTVIAADFTDFILEFTANANEEISIVINSGVAPLNGELQMISTGNNKLVPSLTGVTATYPEQTNPKTMLKGWLGGIVTGTDKISFNGSLEGTATAGIEEAPQDSTPYSRQDAGWVAATDTTYSVFNNTDDGLVPAPNIQGGTITYSAAITSPTEGFTVTEGQVTTVNVDMPAGVESNGAPKVLEDTGWNYVNATKRIDFQGATTLILASEKNRQIRVTHGGSIDTKGTLSITYPRPITEATEIIFISCYASTYMEVVGNTDNIIVPAEGCTNRIKKNGSAVLIRTGAGIGNQTHWALYGDLVLDFEIFKSPNGTLYKVGVDDAGNRTAVVL